MSDLDFLKDVDSFQGLTDEQLQQLQAGCNQIEFQQGERIFEEGETAEHVWVLKQGNLDLRFELPGRQTAEENTISSAGANETLGYSSFVPPFKYKLSAYCTSRTCDMVQLEKTYLLGLFEKDPGLGFRVISNLAGVASSHFNQLLRSATVAPPAAITITVHMATCGIAAGSRDVMLALTDELAHADRRGIRLESGGCIGDCQSHPNITVAIAGTEPVVYQKLTAETAKRVFERHVLHGEVQADLVLAPDAP